MPDETRFGAGYLDRQGGRCRGSLHHPPRDRRASERDHDPRVRRGCVHRPVQGLPGRDRAPARHPGGLDRALDRPAEIADRLPPEEAGLDLLHRSADLTVLNVVWAPQMRALSPRPPDVGRHRHLRRPGGQRLLPSRPTPGDGDLVESGGKRLDERDIVLLGDDAIHRVANPARTSPAPSTSTAATSSPSHEASGCHRRCWRSRTT